MSDKTHLYERVKAGDKRTIVRKFKKGHQLTFSGDETMTFKTDCNMKVTQTYVKTVRHGKSEYDWEDSSYHTESVTECAPKNEKKDDMPVARLNVGWWDRVKEFFTKEA